MHIHLSCVYKEGDVRSVFITMLQKIQQSRGEQVDVLSGSRVITNTIYYQKPKFTNETHVGLNVF